MTTRATYHPAHAIAPGAIGQPGTRGRLATQTEVRVPFLDEDEATLAVEAAGALLQAAKFEASTLARIRVASATRTGWATTLARALGAHNIEPEELSTEEWPRERARASASEAVLWVESQCPRPRSSAMEELALPAQAGAELTGPAAPKGPDLRVDADRPTFSLSRETYEALAREEARAPGAVPMGAYVPLATWNATRDARYRLMASSCPQCHAAQHPPLDPCPACGGPTHVAPLPRRGHLYSFTRIAKGGGPSEFDPLLEVAGHYDVAVVEFEAGVRVPGMVAEAADVPLKIGQPMEAVFRRLYAQEGAWRYGTKFRPAST